MTRQLAARSTQPSQTIVVPGPRLNIENCDALKERGVSLVNSGTRHVTLDMSEVDFVDSSGVGAMVAIRKALGSDGTVRLLNCRPFINNVLELTKLTHVFEVG